MYPATFFGLFPAFPRDHRAFVAMSFEHRFDVRWNRVLRRGLESVLVNDQPLEPHRIDLTMSGDSVLTGILDEIGRCRVVVADISALGALDGRPVRNENVFYEVALAHAVRLPEEVVMFRSDTERLAFDISNVRVHQYDPDENPDAARTIVTDAVAGSLNELSLRHHLAIRRAAESLDADGFMVLGEAMGANGVKPPNRANLAEALTAGPKLDAISRLLDLTAIRAEYFRVTLEALADPTRLNDAPLVRYRTTSFGEALFEHMVELVGLGDSAVQEQVSRMISAGTIASGPGTQTNGPTT